MVFHSIDEYITFLQSSSCWLKLDFCDEITMVVMMKQKRQMPKNVASLLVPIQAKINKWNHTLKWPIFFYQSEYYETPRKHSSFQLENEIVIFKWEAQYNWRNKNTYSEFCLKWNSFWRRIRMNRWILKFEFNFVKLLSSNHMPKWLKCNCAVRSIITTNRPMKQYALSQTIEKRQQQTTNLTQLISEKNPSST